MTHDHTIGTDVPADPKFVFDDAGYFKGASIMLDRFFDDDELEFIYTKFQEQNRAGTFMVLDGQLGGVAGLLPHDHNAYSHRSAISSVQIYTKWEDPSEEQDRIEFVEDVRAHLQNAGRGSYRNYCDVLVADWQNAYYGSHYERLQRIKTKYDPINLFAYAQSVAPN